MLKFLGLYLNKLFDLVCFYSENHVNFIDIVIVLDLEKVMPMKWNTHIVYVQKIKCFALSWWYV
jgi:hypothetical protein